MQHFGSVQIREHPINCFKMQNHREPHALAGHLEDTGESFVHTVVYLCRLMLKLQPKNIKTYSLQGANYIMVLIIVAKI